MPQSLMRSIHMNQCLWKEPYLKHCELTSNYVPILALVMVVWRSLEHYMAAWRYEFYLLVLKVSLTSVRSEDKIRILKRPCNILYIFHFIALFVKRVGKWKAPNALGPKRHTPLFSSLHLWENQITWFLQDGGRHGAHWKGVFPPEATTILPYIVSPTYTFNVIDFGVVWLGFLELSKRVLQLIWE